MSRKLFSCGGIGWAIGETNGIRPDGALEELRGGALGRGGLNEGSDGARGDTGIEGRTAPTRVKRGGDLETGTGGVPGYAGHSSKCWLTAAGTGRMEGEGRGPRGTEGTWGASAAGLLP